MTRPDVTPLMAFAEGDGKITRKITACVACRKQKIKCSMKEGQGQCARCKKRGLSCTVNKSLQMILQSDVEWKQQMERKLRCMEMALGRAGIEVGEEDDDMNVEVQVTLAEEDEGSRTTSHSCTPATARPCPSPAAADKHGYEIELVMDPDSGPAAIPGSVVSPIAMPGFETNRAQQDIISRGIVSVQQAQSYLDIYQNRLDHFLYRIIGDRKNLREVRAASPILLAAICAVGSLHLNTPAFEGLYQEFVSIAAAQTFSRRNNVDDIRGLCVAAFWLSDVSWSCIGTAVRIATEIQLHRSIFKALDGDRNHYLRTRLWYLVYVCDHHFSVAYGRPPMTRQCDAIRACLRFLDTEHAVEDDHRLISQVQFWTIGGEIYETFGVDVDRPLNRAMLSSVGKLSSDLDHVRDTWYGRFKESRYVGSYPRKGVVLHCHFAKLYLSSMAFRGIGQPSFKSPDIAPEINALAEISLHSASAILHAVIEDEEIQGHLNGLPMYFDVMIAFAVVFVLKVSTKYASSVPVDTSHIPALVENTVRVLQRVTANMHPRHLLVSVARGAATLFNKTCPTHGAVPANANVIMSKPTFDESLYDMSADWNNSTFDNFYMGEYDFLSNQNIMNSFQPDLNYVPQM